MEAPPQGMEGGRVAQVRLPKPAGGIAGGLEAVAEGRLLDGEPHRRGRQPARAGIEFVSEPLLITAGEESGPGRTAVGTAHVAVGEPHAVGSQRIDLGRGHVGGKTLTAQFTVSQIIGQEDQDVGTPARKWAGVLGRAGVGEHPSQGRSFGP